MGLSFFWFFIHGVVVLGWLIHSLVARCAVRTCSVSVLLQLYMYKCGGLPCGGCDGLWWCMTSVAHGYG